MADSSNKDKIKKPEKLSKPGDAAFNAWHTQKRRKKRKEAQG
jgi:hypothetical protein